MQIADDDSKAIRTDFVRSKWDEASTEVGQRPAFLSQIFKRASFNREVLRRDGVTILQPAIFHATPINPPKSPDGGKAVGGVPSCLFKSIQGKIALVSGYHIRQFVDTEVFGRLLDLHKVIERISGAASG